MRSLDETFKALDRSPFRVRQRLGAREQRQLVELGLNTVLVQARAILEDRLVPAQLKGDGRQTPFQGHPVFVAQHATATCCRKCLAKWHGIGTGAALTAEEVDYVLQVLRRWLQSQPLSSITEKQRRFDW